MFPLSKKKPYRSDKHLQWVKKHNCIACQSNYGIDAHHIIGVGLGGTMGGKESDALTIPLCRSCHKLVHKDPNVGQLAYFARFIKRAFEQGEIILNMNVETTYRETDDRTRKNY